MPLAGAFRLFRFAGIDVFLHWSWFLVAIFEILSRRRSYHSPAWNVLETLALFAIILTHEFGHALACRQVGGRADRIMLWPLGGVAYVTPPDRPGATLWSIAAGPLVNVALCPLLLAAYAFAGMNGWAFAHPDEYLFIRAVLGINLGLLVFNILPLYPLDGGQILRSLLWFLMGRARSLLVTSIIGFVGIIGLIALALRFHSNWSVMIALYLLMSCWRGLQHARQLLRVGETPRRAGLACPGCHTAPPVGPFWGCARCHRPFDTFATNAVCPACSAPFPVTMCLNCKTSYPLEQWSAGATGTPALIIGQVAPQR
jgi:Zn-dependent protease